ncbi:hypothetical protein HOY80DRAFT_991710 [Tuber brumale]|nr:hypothetical protein HOY80DRAFT_991710 [Tuber brumale]
MSVTGKDSQSDTLPTDRSQWRDTYIYASDNRAAILGGLLASEGITNANLYSMLEIFCFFTDTYALIDGYEQLVERDGQQLQPGNYYIVTNDSRCVITGRPAVLGHIGRWRGFEATHIFPLAYEEQWNDSDYSRFITIPPAIDSHGPIYSVQNGILLTSDMQQFFDSYDLAINADDNYEIVCFTPNLTHYHIGGRHLDQSFTDNPLRPVDALLRRHFRQTVLTNMKGAGAPSFETDFPAGSDMMSEIQRGPKAAERMEFELFSRFNARGDHS